MHIPTVAIDKLSFFFSFFFFFPCSVTEDLHNLRVHVYDMYRDKQRAHNATKHEGRSERERRDETRGVGTHEYVFIDYRRDRYG